MFPVLRRTHLVAGAAALAAGAAGGGALASAHLSPVSAAPASTLTAATAPAQPSPQAAGRSRAHRRLERRMGKITAVSATSITVTDARGRSSTFTITDRTRVVAPERAEETVADLRSGEVVMVAGARPAERASLSAAAPAAASSAASSAPPVAALIVDSGFQAA